MNGNTVRNTTLPLEIEVKKSGFVSDGETPIPPTLDLYQQIIGEMQSPAYVANANAAAKAANDAAERADRAAENAKEIYKVALRSADGSIMNLISDVTAKEVYDKVCEGYLVIFSLDVNNMCYMLSWCNESQAGVVVYDVIDGNFAKLHFVLDNNKNVALNITPICKVSAS